MKGRRIALGLAIGLFGWILVVSRGDAQTLSSVTGYAYGAYVQTATAALDTTPLVILPPGGGMGDAELANVSVVNLLTTKALSTVTTGVIGENAASAQSHATVQDVSILGGVVSAKLVVAMVSSASNGTTASSNAVGSTLVDLIVNGVSMGDVTPALNTRIDIPGVGTVILNEQMPSGDGVTTTGLTVNMIHVVLKDALTGAPAGDIVVGSAQSAAGFAR